MRASSTITLALLVGFAAAGLLATGASAQPASCNSERRSDFDFWIGEWQVSAQGAVAGTNSIQPLLDGCVLQERWSGAGGSAGTSFNFYDPSRGRWRQLWVWQQGTTLELEGGLVEGSMVLAGPSKARDGSTIENRITWTPAKDGSVRQLWEVSRDGGASWQVSFDGHYTRSKATPEGPVDTEGKAAG